MVNLKLFVLNGALFTRIFGFSLYSLKAVSLFWFVLFILLFGLYTTRWQKIFSKYDLLLAMIVLFSFHEMFKYSFIFRPEVMMMTLGFAGFIQLQAFLKRDGGKNGYLYAFGFLFGLTAAVHLNGIIFIAAAIVLLIWDKKFEAVVWFTLAVLPGFSLFFYDMTSASDFSLWKHQFFESPSLDGLNQDTGILKPVFNLFNEHQRYFHDDRVLGFTVFMLLAVLSGFGFVYRKHTNLFRFALLVAIFTGMFAMHKSKHYLLLNFPYLLLLTTLSVKAVKEGKIKTYLFGRPQFISSALATLFFVYLLSANYFNAQLAFEKFSPEENRERAIQYSGQEKGEMNIVAPMSFIFNEIEQFNRIQGVLCYIELQKSDPGIYGVGFLRKAATFNTDLIVVPPYYQTKLGINLLNTGDVIGNYQIIDKTAYALVFKRLPV